MIEPRAHILDLFRREDFDPCCEGILRLHLNELAPQLAEPLFREIASRLTPNVFNTYPDLSPQYEKLARSLRVSAEQLLFCHGAAGGIRHVFDVICDPGDHVVLVEPNFGLYQFYARLHQLPVGIAEYELPHEFPLNSAKGSVGCRTKLVIVSSPNAKLGLTVGENALRQLLSACQRKGVAVLLDETYAEFDSSAWHASVDEFDNLIVLRSFSKAGGLAGLRAGYLLSNRRCTGLLRKVRPYCELNGVAAIAIDYLIENPEIIRDNVALVASGREYLASRLKDMGCIVISGDANFVLADFGIPPKTVRTALAREGVLIAEAGPKICASYCRITAGPIDLMEKVLASIKRCHFSICHSAEKW